MIYYDNEKYNYNYTEKNNKNIENLLGNTDYVILPSIDSNNLTLYDLKKDCFKLFEFIESENMLNKLFKNKIIKLICKSKKGNLIILCEFNKNLYKQCLNDMIKFSYSLINKN